MTFSEALENDSVKEWKESHLANISCADQFDNEYGARYHARDVPAFLKEMTDRYGLERCMLVLAGTIQLSPWDKRYHQPVREGAAKIQVPGASDIPTEDRRRDYLVKCHPVMVDVAFRILWQWNSSCSTPGNPPKRKALKRKHLTRGISLLSSAN